MEAGEGLSVSLVILDEPAEAGRPCEGSFDDPSARQQDETALGLGQLDDLEFDAMLGRRLLGTLPGIALIDPGDLDAV